MSQEEHAEHAQVGEDHLEIHRVLSGWPWWVINRKNELTAKGEADSLAAAKEAASKAVGKTVSEIEWKRIGP
jgi:hypothetical protein